jgi:hypothetical protein
MFFGEKCIFIHLEGKCQFIITHVLGGHIVKFMIIFVTCAVVGFGGFIFVTDKIDAREQAKLDKQAQIEAERKEAKEKAALLRAEQKRIAKEKELERVRLLAEQKAQKAKMFAEQRQHEEEERVRTLPARLATAETELKQAQSDYDLLLEKEKELKEIALIKESKMRAAQRKADSVGRLESSARSTKNRAEGQYQPTHFDSGARRRSPRREQERARREERGTTIKTGEAQAAAERAAILYDEARVDWEEAEAQLNEALVNLNEKQSTFDSIKNEKPFVQEISVALGSLGNEPNSLFQ